MGTTIRMILICLLAGGLAPASAQEAPFGGPSASAPAEITMRLVPSHLFVQPGQKLSLAVDVRIDDGWVFYSTRPGSYAKAAAVTVQAPHLNIAAAAWPQPQTKATQIGDETVVNNVYKHRAIIYVPLQVPELTESLTEIELTVTLTGQICQTQCVDVLLTQRVTLQVASKAVTNPDWETDEYAAAVANLPAPVYPATQPAREAADPATVPMVVADTQTAGAWFWLGLAVLAGLSLNIMPCVLPIVPIRIHSVIATAGQSRRRFVTLGLAFALGVWLFFGGFAVANIIIHQIFGESLSWSAQWKVPEVRLGLALLVVAVAANLWGAFTITVPSKVASLEPGKRKGGHLGSVGMGLMLAILATPCSAGVLLGVLGWAQGQPLWLATLAICLMGVGMALPHAVLCAFPQLVARLPKPGRWMELFKQSMGFVLLPLALWLLTTLGPDVEKILQALIIAAVFATALWVWGTWIRYDTPAMRRWIYRGIILAGMVVAVWALLPQWEGVDTGLPARVQSARDEGNVVVVKVTASWCLECKVIDYYVYQNPEVIKALAAADVVKIIADVSNTGPATDWLRTFQADSPPYTLVFPPRPGGPIALRGTDISTEKLLAAIATAREQ